MVMASGHGHSFVMAGDAARAQLIRYRVIAVVLECGIVVHSVVIGISLGASSNVCSLKSLVVALSFHQLFEGMGLGGCILQLPNSPNFLNFQQQQIPFLDGLPFTIPHQFRTTAPSPCSSCSRSALKNPLLLLMTTDIFTQQQPPFRYPNQPLMTVATDPLCLLFRLHKKDPNQSSFIT
ncbi:hypothetical protein MKW92_003598 [Papaver armeniacum]|nr:hypothetical protein MKW92_003598 [Papaver armeniacum]